MRITTMKFGIRTSTALLVLATLVALAPTATADVWEPGDNTATGTENELAHRSEQIHDLAGVLGAADNDFYRIAAPAYSSYEIVVDGTGAESSAVVLDRVDSAGVPITNSIGISSIGYTRVLRVENATSTPRLDYIRVKSGLCTTACTAAAVYRIRAYDTSYSIERFYDNNTVFTNVVLQNPNDYSINFHIMYFRGSVADDLLNPPGVEAHSLSARNAVVLGPPSGFTAVAGHIIITSDGGYDALRGKAAQFDTNPSSPQSWDNDLLIRR